MPEYALAIDAGTTRIRALLIDANRRVVGRAHTGADISHPAPGRVEQDPARLWEATRHVIETALSAADVPPRGVAGIGIATQRGNVVVWDKDTGRAVSPLVSWQDLRGTTRTAELLSEGFLVSHQMSAAKLESVLAGIDSGFDRLNAGKLLWGNLDTYLAWQLSGGTLYATDHSQACATGYYDYFTGEWNTTLIERQRLDPARFPALIDSIGQLGTSDAPVFGAACPIGALLADQQSATIAQECLTNGLHKVSYGTSATLDANTGTTMLFAPGCYPMVLYKHAGGRTFCIEGMVNTAGAMIDWVVAELGLAATPDALSQLASRVNDCAGAFTLPALQGLGAPHGDATRNAMVGGLSRATTRSHIARAVFEGIAFRVREAADAIRSAPEVQLADHLRVDGGASRSDTLMQIQADVLGLPIERLAIPEATALGAAIGAGSAVGLWDLQTARFQRHIDRTFLPSWSNDEREGRYDTWRRRCGLISG
jgi:glycerol kinase